MLIFDQLKRNEPELRWLSVTVLFGLGILFTGLWYVQIFSTKKYQTSLENQSYRSISTPAVRGRIFDRNGAILAENRPSYSVNLYIEEIRSEFSPVYRRLKAKFKKDNPDVDYDFDVISRVSRAARFEVIQKKVASVAKVLGRDIQVYERAFNEHYRSKTALPFTIARDLSPQDIARFYEQPLDHTGIDIDLEPARWYPYGNSAAHILGHLKRDTQVSTESKDTFDYHLPGLRGVVGIEGKFDSKLRGVAGGKSVLVNNLGYRVEENVWLPPVAGDDVHLTIDIDIQQIAENAIRTIGSHVRGAVVVLDPRNGDIVAMVSAPTFDPNDFPGISSVQYSELNDPKTRAFFNRASQEIYPPGSTFKIVTALACLNSGAVSPDTKYQGLPAYPIGRGIKCTAAPRLYNLRSAFAISCNCYFIHHALEARAANLVEMGHRFFLGQRSQIPTMQDSAGAFPSLERVATRWYDGDTANLSIGQGPIAATPLQMATITGTVANGGTIYWPRLVSRIAPANNLTGRVPRDYPEGRIRGYLGVQPEHVQTVQQAMYDDIYTSLGTGRIADVDGMQIGGKTGTAEVKKGRTLVDKIVWFTSFASIAPGLAPQYAVTVVVESGGSGGKTCAPVAQKIYKGIQDLHRLRASQLETTQNP